MVMICTWAVQYNGRDIKPGKGGTKEICTYREPPSNAMYVSIVCVSICRTCSSSRFLRRAEDPYDSARHNRLSRMIHTTDGHEMNSVLIDDASSSR